MAITTSGCILADDAGDPGVAPEDRDRPCWENIHGERIDLEPFFDPEREDKMVLPEEEMLSVYDTYEDEDYPEYKAYIDTRDQANTVLFNVEVYPTVEEAETHYNETTQVDGAKDYGFGDQAAKHTDGDYAEMTIRVSNAVGHVISYIPEAAPEDPEDRTFSPRGRVLRFAEELHDYWAGTSSFENQPGFCRDEVKALQQPDEDN